MKLNFWDSTNDNVNVDIGTVNKEGKYNFTSLHSLPPSYSISFHLILYHHPILKYAPSSSSSSSSSSSVSVIRSAAKA